MTKKVFAVAAAVSACCGFAESEKAAQIPFRGVVEGYYGRPFGTEGRLSTLEFMGENNMNVFIYGPKDDPYHHAKWKEPYPEADMADFRRLLECAKKNNIHFYWAIHLGGTFYKIKNPGEKDAKQEFEADFDSLFRKLGWMYDNGFRAFAAFFDDYGGADASTHAEICNRIQHEFIEKKGDCAPLVMCPNVYWGSGHKYQKTLGAELDMAVQIMWTGRSICSDIRAVDVEKITKDFRRAPYVWWNWPVNDYCRSSLLLGRTYGLDNAPIAGIVANPMENCEANKIALYSFAKWCDDPVNFDSQKCWEESFAKIYSDPEIAAAMRVFAEHNSDPGRNSHGYRREESVSVLPLVEKARREFAENGKCSHETVAGFASLFWKIDHAAETLLRKLPKDKGLGWEIEGWLENERMLMSAGIKTLEFIGRDDEESNRRLMNELVALRKSAQASAEAHKAKFKAATFPKDGGNVKSPQASAGVLSPLIDTMVEIKLRKIYELKTGRSIDKVMGLASFSNVKAMQGPPMVKRDGIAVGLERVMEPKEVLPGEWFGIGLPEGWNPDFFHAKLGSSEAVKAGVIEFSKDGKTWIEGKMWSGGEETNSRLLPKERWRFARYRNASDAPVSVKINLFKFDVRNAKSLIDMMLEELLQGRHSNRSQIQRAGFQMRRTWPTCPLQGDLV